jgi:hypothetical protein
MSLSIKSSATIRLQPKPPSMAHSMSDSDAPTTEWVPDAEAVQWYYRAQERAERVVTEPPNLRVLGKRG